MKLTTAKVVEAGVVAVAEEDMVETTPAVLKPRQLKTSGSSLPWGQSKEGCHFCPKKGRMSSGVLVPVLSVTVVYI